MLVCVLRARSGVVPVKQVMLGIKLVAVGLRGLVGMVNPIHATPVQNASSIVRAQSSVR